MIRHTNLWLGPAPAQLRVAWVGPQCDGCSRRKPCSSPRRCQRRWRPQASCPSLEVSLKNQSFGGVPRGLYDMLPSSCGTSLPPSVVLTTSPVHAGVPCYACVCFLSVLAMVVYRSIVWVVLADALSSSFSCRSPRMLCCRDCICSYMADALSPRSGLSHGRCFEVVVQLCWRILCCQHHFGLRGCFATEKMLVPVLDALPLRSYGSPLRWMLICCREL